MIKPSTLKVDMTRWLNTKNLSIMSKIDIFNKKKEV